MTNENIERAINFVVEQQAQFAADIQQLKETQIEFQNQLKQVGAVQLEFQNQLKQLTEATIASFTMLGKLTEIQSKTDQRIVETNDRLNIFIDVVERYISSRNGRSDEQNN